MTSDALAARAELLESVFPGTPPGRVDYLGWLYDKNPDGTVIATDVADDQGIAGHYAVVPVTLGVGMRTVRGALSLNTAVHPRSQGGGIFTRLATSTFRTAQERGVEQIIGVANANSTPGFVRRLEFRSHGPLPVSVIAPTPGRRAALTTVPGPEARELLDRASPHLVAPTGSWTRRWTAETLDWRLRAPGARYLVHEGPDLLVISTATRVGPVRVALLLAVLSADAVGVRRGRAVIRTICARHRAPVALHAGFNAHLRLSGLPLPSRLRPSPLNLVSRSLGGVGDLDSPSRFEFLDFDAY